MNTVDENDEELGNVRTVSQNDSSNDNDSDNDNDVDNDEHPERKGSSAPPNVGSRGFFRQRLAREDGERGAGGGGEGGGGTWKSLGSRNRIRFASTRYSDLLSNGTAEEVRGIVATPLDADRCRPMGTGARFLENVEDALTLPNFQFLRQEEEEDGGDGEGGIGGGGEDTGGGGSSDEGGENCQMYRLQATRGSGDLGCCRRTLKFLSACVNCGALTESATDQNLYLGFGDPNRYLVYLFHWLFRKGWSTVVFLSVAWYYALVLAFAALIVWAAAVDADCVRIGGKRFGDLENRSKFVDSFSLSWNTFSTVGYGSTYPALSGESVEEDDGGRCAFINFVTSFEALVGVVFAGFVGAVFFAKVSRITQGADVTFSDPLTVRFGRGADATGSDGAEEEDDDGEDVPRNEIEKLRRREDGRAADVIGPSPFPVMTFRIANEKHDVLGGEIIGASVNAVVLIESTKYDDQVSEDLAKQIAMHRMRRASGDSRTPGARMRTKQSTTGASKSSGHVSERTSETTNETVSLDDDLTSTERSKRGTDNAMAYLQGLNTLAHKARFGSKKMKIDEQEESGADGSKIVPRMVFTKLELETSEHPLFKRIWRFKHVIDPDSPLLTSEAQKAIMENGGRWPREWNHHRAVRKAIRFNQMVVSFTGISNISGASVYKQKVYDYVDTVVGYQFVNALYRGRRGNLKVDLRLINDVSEQTGGGGEPLHVTSKGSTKDTTRVTQGGVAKNAD